jgi:hypothetical protein
MARRKQQRKGKHMKLRNKLLLAVGVLFILSACSNSTLSYDKSKLNLHVNNVLLQVHGTQLKSNRENFSILFLDQKLIRLDDGSMVIYEYGRTDIAYEFAKTTRRTIDTVFDAQQIVEVYNKALVYAYQIVLSDGRILNTVVSQSYDQEISMVYGMSSEKLDKILKRLNPLARPVPYRHAITLEHEANPLLSRWTTWKINFVPLVQPLPRFMRL